MSDFDDDIVDADWERKPAPAALAVTETRPLANNGVMPVVTPEEARAQMEAYTAIVNAVLGPEDYQSFKERGKEKRFKKKSAVKKLQTYFGFTVSIIESHRDELPDGHFGFRVKARATSPNGRYVESLAGCATTEERFELTPNDYENGPDDPKFLNRQRKALARAYHDVLSTAETRATNRAAMNLIGAGEVTAEEIQRPAYTQREPAPPRQPQAPAFDSTTFIPRAVALGLIAKPDRDLFMAWAKADVPGCEDMDTMRQVYALKIEAFLKSKEGK